MAELNDKLYYKLNGVTDEITCYTTLAEVQNQGIPLKRAGVACYAKYGPESDANASQGNYKPAGGTAQKILKQAQIPYGEQSYTSAGTFTFTVPSGVTKLRITARGGGGGGGGGMVDTFDGNYICYSGGKGGPGGSIYRRAVAVTPNTIYTVTVGGGGYGGIGIENDSPLRAGGSGNATSFGNLMTATGGKGAPGRYPWDPMHSGESGSPMDSPSALSPYGNGGVGGYGKSSGGRGASGAVQIEWGGDIQ